MLIARALEKRLATLTPAVAIAPENGTYQPQTGTPYQALAFLPAETETTDVAQTVHIETGFFQVTVCYPSGSGPVAARIRAELVRSHFPAGLRLEEGGQEVEVIGRPRLAPAQTPGGWFCVPVRIRFKAVVRS